MQAAASYPVNAAQILDLTVKLGNISKVAENHFLSQIITIVAVYL